MTTYAEYENDAEPPARPSRPSVRFTALVAPRSSSTAHTPHRTGDRWMPVVPTRVKERSVLTFTFSVAIHANATPTSKRPANFVRLLSPRLRALLTLITSSMRPTTPL